MMARGYRLLLVAVIASVAVRSVASTCVGDCHADGRVDIADLILGVNIALELRPIAECEAFANAVGTVDVGQLIRGVNSALNGCPGPPTPSVTRVPSDTPSATFTPTAENTPTITPQPGEHFVDRGDGTITDNQTGLIWEKKGQNRDVHDVNTRYRWAGLCTDSGESCQPDDGAAGTCEAATGGAIGCARCAGRATCNTDGFMTIWEWLNQLNGASFAGHDDWRIPAVGREGGVVELESIVDTSVPKCGTGVPCVAAAFDTDCLLECTVTGCSCTQPDFYWSVISGVGSPPFAFGVFFPDGRVIGTDKAAAFYVRAVRSG